MKSEWCKLLLVLVQKTVTESVFGARDVWKKGAMRRFFEASEKSKIRQNLPPKGKKNLCLACCAEEESACPHTDQSTFPTECALWHRHRRLPLGDLIGRAALHREMIL